MLLKEETVKQSVDALLFFSLVYVCECFSIFSSLGQRKNPAMVLPNEHIKPID